MEDFFKCYCLPELYAIVGCVLAFLFAYIFYKIVTFAFHNFFVKDGLGERVVRESKGAGLLLLYAVALAISFNLFNLTQFAIVRYALVILIIALVGWLLLRIARGFYIYTRNRYEKQEVAEMARRNLVTQLLFLYRAIIFVILIITLSAILISIPYIRSIGIGLLGSAGIIGAAIGIAARPIILNVIAGFHIALTKTLRIGDAIILNGDFARVEHIHLTHLIAKTWDLRCVVVPISQFVDHSFENWSIESPELIAKVFLYCDYSAPVEKIRERFIETVKAAPSWNGRMCELNVTNATEKTMELRFTMSAKDATQANTLQHYMREKMINFLQKEHPGSLPRERYEQLKGSP